MSVSATDKRTPSALRIQLRRGFSGSEIGKAWKDIIDGRDRWQLWGTIGFHEVRQRYRRSVLGPFWITLSMGIMVSALGLLYGKIFQLNLDEYLPYLSIGFVSWALISGLILDGTRTFIDAEPMLRQINAPVSVYVYGTVWSNLITFAHNIWVYFFVALWFGINPGWHILLAFPALALILVNGMWAGILFGLLGVRFRDVPLIVASVVQVMFFITPIIWKPDMLPGRALVLDLNPFYHIVEILRAPFLGDVPDAESWIAALVVTFVGWLVTLFFYAAYRWRIAYWT